MNLRDIRYKVRYKGDKIIFVSPTKILDRLEQDSPSYSIRGGKNQIGNRVQRAKEYIIKNWNNPEAKKIQRYPIFEPSVVGIYNDIISFGDGRHRILAAEELGIPEVAVEIPRNQEHLFDYMKVKPDDNDKEEERNQYWNEQSTNVYCKGKTNGEVIDDWLDRNKIRKEGELYIFYHGTPRKGGAKDYLKTGSLLAYTPEDAYHFAARDRDLKIDQIKLIQVSVDKRDLIPGVFPSLRVNLPIYDYRAISESKLNESPDSVFIGGDGDVNKSSNWVYLDSKWSISFGFKFKNGRITDVAFGENGETHSYSDNLFDKFKYFNGRLWTNKKIISFWTFPKTKSLFNDIIFLFEERLKTKFWDDGWRVEIWRSSSYSLEPIEKFKNSDDVPDEERQIHLMNSAEKDMLRKAGKDPLKYYKSLGKQTPLAYKQAIYQEKMNESPDNIIYKEQEIKWTNGQALPFDCVIESSELKVCVGDWGTSHVSIHHQDNWKLTIKYPGRLWIGEKIISFWTYPNRKDFEDIINQLEVILKEKMSGNISNKIWNNGWKIEIFLFKGEVAIDKNYLQCISSKNGKENITTKLIPIEEYLKSEDQPDELRKLHLMSSAEKDMLRKSGKDPLKYYKSLGSNKNIEPIDILKNKQLMYQENMKNRKDYLDWKRKNVTLRGIKELGKYNDVYGSFGKGLYTVPLSNKIMTKQYGKLYYVINAIPKHPKIVDSLNNAEIWIQNLIINFSKNNNRKEYYDLQFFKENTTIEDEMIKLGYDGLIIKGREMVNYKPHQDVKYFETENELEKYFEFITMYQEKMNESPDHIDKYNLTYKNDYAIPFIGHLQGDDVIVAIGEGGETHDSISIKGFKWVDDNCRNYSGRLWLNKKIISFWNYPNSEVFVKIIDELEEKLKLKIWNKKWTIETVFFDKNTPIDRQVPDWRMVNGTSDVQIISIENYMKSEDVPDEERQLHLMSSAEKDMLRKAGKDPLKYYKSLGSNKNIEPIDILKNKQLMYQEKVLYKNEHYKSNESIITKFQDFENNI